MDEQLHQHYLFFKRQLGAEFGLRDLWDIALELEMNPEHWPHHSVPELADGLLRVIDRRRYHQELVTILRRERPSIAWPDAYHYPTSVVINEEAIFDPAKIKVQQVDLRIISTSLQEWKVVHYNVQRLLLSIHRWERTLYKCEQTWRVFSTHKTIEKRIEYESTINDVDDGWKSHCQRKLLELRAELAQLIVIRHSLISSLVYVLAEEHERNINYCVRQLRPDLDQSLRLLRVSFNELDELLVETLTAADLHILQYANLLNERLDTNKSY